MNIKTLFAAAALATTLCTAAGAITFEGALTQGGTVVTNFSGTGLVSFDIDFASLAPVLLNFRVDNADVPGTIALSAMLRNFTGNGITGFDFVLDRGSFSSMGSVTPQFGGTASSMISGGMATVRFSAPEFLDVEIGNALGSTAGAADWTLGGLAAGDRFTLTVTAVPEPGTYALFLAGLAALGLKARRRGVARV